MSLPVFNILTDNFIPFCSASPVHRGLYGQIYRCFARTNQEALLSRLKRARFASELTTYSLLQMDEASNLGVLLSNYVYSQTRWLAVDGFISQTRPAPYEKSEAC